MAETAADDAAKANVTPETFYQAVEELGALTVKKDNIVSQIRRCRQKFKGLGIDLSELDGAVADKKKHDDDPTAYAMAVLTRARYRAWLDLPAGSQPSMFAEPAPEQKERLTKYNAHAQGYEACKRGDPRSSNPHEAGTLAHVAFDNGWQDREKDEFEGAAAPATPAKRKPAKGAGPEVDPNAAPVTPKRGRPRKNVIVEGATIQ